MRYKNQSFFQGDTLYLNCDICGHDKGVIKLTGYDRLEYGPFECEECLTKKYAKQRTKLRSNTTNA